MTDMNSVNLGHPGVARSLWPFHEPLSDGFDRVRRHSAVPKLFDSSQEEGRESRTVGADHLFHSRMPLQPHRWQGLRS